MIPAVLFMLRCGSLKRKTRQGRVFFLRKRTL